MPARYIRGSSNSRKKNGEITVAGSKFEDGKPKLDTLFANKPDMLKFTRDLRGMGPPGQDLPLIPDGHYRRRQCAYPPF